MSWSSAGESEGSAWLKGSAGVGVPLTLFERDSHPAGRWEGYCIHIDPAGARSLHACLPDNLWQAFLATSAPGGDCGPLTEQLHELLVVEEAISHPRHTDPTESHYVVDRRPLRRVLLADLGETVRSGRSSNTTGSPAMVASLSTSPMARALSGTSWSARHDSSDAGQRAPASRVVLRMLTTQFDWAFLRLSPGEAQTRLPA